MENSVHTMRKRNSNIFEDIFSALLIFYLLWKQPIVALYMNTYLAMIILVFSFGLLLIHRNRWIKEVVSIVLVFIIVVLLDFYDNITSGMSLFNSIWSMFLSIFPVFVGCIVATNRMDSVIRKVVPTMIIVYTITAITTYVGLLRFPGASRILAADPLAYLKYYPLNIGGFEFIYSLVLLHPLVIYLFRKVKRLRYAIPFSVIVALCVVASEYTMGVLLFVLSLVAYLLPVNMSPVMTKRRLRRVLILVLIVCIFVPFILGFVSKFDFLGSSGEKLLDISKLLQGELVEDDSDIAIRQNVYIKSFEAFLKRPVIGSKIFGSPTVGGHSFILDTLGNWGMVGLAMILALFFKFKKLYKKEFANREAGCFVVLFLMMVFILWGFNPKSWLFELGFMAPMLLCYIDTSALRVRKRRR